MFPPYEKVNIQKLTVTSCKIFRKRFITCLYFQVEKIMLDVNTLPITLKRVRPLEKQRESESRKLVKFFS